MSREIWSTNSSCPEPRDDVTGGMDWFHPSFTENWGPQSATTNKADYFPRIE